MTSNPILKRTAEIVYEPQTLTVLGIPIPAIRDGKWGLYDDPEDAYRHALRCYDPAAGEYWEVWKYNSRTGQYLGKWKPAGRR
jgi:hypothetical protein